MQTWTPPWGWSSCTLKRGADLSCSRWSRWSSQSSVHSGALPALCHTSRGSSRHVCRLLLGLVAHTYWLLPLWRSVISHFYEEKRRAGRCVNLDPGREANTRLANNPTDLWEPCVSVCVPWGPLCMRWVRGGQGFNKGRRLVLGCQSERLRDTQPDGVQMKATRLDVLLPTSSTPVHQLSPLFL